MSLQEFEYYKQRSEESTTDLYDTVTTIRKIMTAKVIDWTFFFSGLIFVTWFAVENDYINHIFVAVAMFLFLVIYFTFKVIFKGYSLGYFLMGIRFVSVKTKEPVTKREFYEYMKKNLKLEVSYNQIIKYYFTYSEKTSQNLPMRKFGMILVDNHKYKRFYKDYRYILNRLQELETQLS